MKPEPWQIEEREKDYTSPEVPLTALEEKVWAICCEMIASDCAVSRNGYAIKQWARELREIVLQEMDKENSLLI